MLKNAITIGFAALGFAIAPINSLDAAQEENGMPKKTVKVADETDHRFFAIPKKIQLTSEQNTALNEIKQKYAPKAIQLSNQLRDLLTEDQKAARKVAIAKAKTEGITGKARTAAIDQAVNMSDEQKKLLTEIKPELAKLRIEIKQQIYGLLTEEQRTHFKNPNSNKNLPSSGSKPEMPRS